MPGFQKDFNSGNDDVYMKNELMQIYKNIKHLLLDETI